MKICVICILRAQIRVCMDRDWTLKKVQAMDTNKLHM